MKYLEHSQNFCKYLKQDFAHEALFDRESEAHKQLRAEIASFGEKEQR